MSSGSHHVEPAACIDAERVREIRRRLLKWGRSHGQSFPWRKPIAFWQGLVVEVLLQRTRATQVIPVFERFIRSYRTAADFGRATPQELSSLIESLGLRWRAPLLHQLALEIGQRKGRLPRSQQELMRLPGIGSYASAAALSLHGNIRGVIIDSNVVRVLSRLFGVEYDRETRRKRWMRVLSERLTPERDHREYNYALIDLAMQLCLPGSPLCGHCPLSSVCAFGQLRVTS